MTNSLKHKERRFREFNFQRKDLRKKEKKTLIYLLNEIVWMGDTNCRKGKWSKLIQIKYKQESLMSDDAPCSNETLYIKEKQYYHIIY